MILARNSTTELGYFAERIRAATAGLLERLDEWENAFAEWRTMSGLMQRENAALSERVTV